jgi:uncharacterized membrane protein
MIHFEFGLLIDRPVADVFAFLSNLNNLPRWQNMIREVKPANDKASGLGAAFTAKGEVMGRSIDGTLEVVEYEPGVRFGYKAKMGPAGIQASVTFKPAGTGTKLSLSANAEPAGIFKLAEGALQGQLKSQMEKNLANLKTLLESGA